MCHQLEIKIELSCQLSQLIFTLDDNERKIRKWLILPHLYSNLGKTIQSKTRLIEL